MTSAALAPSSSCAAIIAVISADAADQPRVGQPGPGAGTRLLLRAGRLGSGAGTSAGGAAADCRVRPGAGVPRRSHVSGRVRAQAGHDARSSCSGGAGGQCRRHCGQCTHPPSCRAGCRAGTASCSRSACPAVLRGSDQRAGREAAPAPLAVGQHGRLSGSRPAAWPRPAAPSACATSRAGMRAGTGQQQHEPGSAADEVAEHLDSRPRQPRPGAAWAAARSPPCALRTGRRAAGPDPHRAARSRR